MALDKEKSNYSIEQTKKILGETKSQEREIFLMIHPKKKKKEIFFNDFYVSQNKSK